MRSVQVIGSTLFIAALIALAGPVRAADGPAATPPTAATGERVGRYTMVPAEGGFVRLDTETGTISQCRRDTAAADAGWRCAVIPEAVLAEPDRTGALAARIDALEAEITRIKARLDAAAPRPLATGDADYDRGLALSEEVMHRFIGLMREMKRGARDSIQDDPGQDIPGSNDPGKDVVRP